MGKIWIIIQREYITRVRRPAFLITTLLAPLGFLLLMVSSVIITTINNSTTHVAVIDESGLFRDIAFADADDKSVYFHKVSETYQDISSLLSDNKESKYHALLHIPSNFNVNTPNNPAIAYRYIERPGLAKRQFIAQRISDAVQQLRMKILQVDETQMEQMQQKVKLTYESLNNIQEKQGYTEAASAAGLMMGFAIYMALFFYGTMIMKGVAEEKTSRIVEVLASSVKPFQLLMGKILGIGAVGLTQFVLWVLLTMVIYVFALPLLGITLASTPAAMTSSPPAEIDTDEITMIVQSIQALPLSSMAVYFPLFFLGGFLLYGSMFAALGSAIGEEGDQQSIMIPVTIPIVISVFLAINVINNPDSSIGFWASVFPLTSPVVMCALLPFNPPWWQVALSLVFLFAGFVGAVWLAGRVYRTGILIYGKKVSLKEIGRWIFSKS